MRLTLLLSTIAIILPTLLPAQIQSGSFVVQPLHHAGFVAGMDAPFTVASMTGEPIPLDSISVYELEYTFHTPDSITAEWVDIELTELGRQTFQIKPPPYKFMVEVRLQSGVERSIFYSRRMQSTPQLGRIHAPNTTDTISIRELQAYEGISGSILNSDIDARCRTESFTTIRLAAEGSYSMVSQTGGRFSRATLGLIARAASGDRYLFIDIIQQCPGNDAAVRPGISLYIK